MSDDDEPVAERTPASCPWCAYVGAFDGRGAFTRSFERIGAEDTTRVGQHWSVHGCTECGHEFAMKEREVTHE